MKQFEEKKKRVEALILKNISPEFLNEKTDKNLEQRIILQLT